VSLSHIFRQTYGVSTSSKLNLKRAKKDTKQEKYKKRMHKQFERKKKMATMECP